LNGPQRNTKSPFGLSRYAADFDSPAQAAAQHDNPQPLSPELQTLHEMLIHRADFLRRAEFLPLFNN
jgi:hypothetical protein